MKRSKLISCLNRYNKTNKPKPMEDSAEAIVIINNINSCPILFILKLINVKFNPILNNISSIQNNNINKFCLL